MALLFMFSNCADSIGNCFFNPIAILGETDIIINIAFDALSLFLKTAVYLYSTDLKG